MDVSVIIVNWNSGSLLRDCILSIISSTSGVSYEIIVVDNCSTDESVALVEEMKQESVRITKLSSNTGFARANNEGIRLSTGEYLLFLNPDTIVHEGSIRDILNAHKKLSENQKVGILVPQLLNTDGSIQESVSRFPVISLQRLLPAASRHTEYGPREIDWARGACFLIKRSTGVELGFWDEDFYLYGEDLELCYRYRRKGYPTYYSPQIRVTHHYNQTAPRRWNSLEILIRKEDGLRRFYKKYLGNRRFIVFELLTLVRLVLKLSTVKDDRERIRLGQIAKVKWMFALGHHAADCGEPS